MKNALVIIDLQNDFLPGGALAVPDGNEIIQPINQLMSSFDWNLASKDWHPQGHSSFASTWGKKVGDEVKVGSQNQKLWPDHCIQNTWGSEHPESFESDQIHHTFYKGMNKNLDSYSIFFYQSHHPSSRLATFLTVHQIKNLYFVGLATEYCVKYSVLDALELGYKVTVFRDCCRGINPKDEEDAFRLMKQKGALLAQSSQVNQLLSPI